MDFQKSDCQLADANFPKNPLHSHLPEVEQIGASRPPRNDSAGFAFHSPGMSTYGDDTHNHGLGPRGRKHRIDESCLNYSGAVPPAAAQESHEVAPMGCTCRLHDDKRIKHSHFVLKQDPFESPFEVNSQSQDAKSNLLSIAEFPSLGTQLAEESTKSKGAFVEFGEWRIPCLPCCPVELPSLQEAGHVADGKSLFCEPQDGSSWPLEQKIDEQALVVRRSAPTAEQWEEMRPLIQQLYIHKGRTLGDVKEKLRESHGFIASKRQLTRMLSKWGFQKNFNQEEKRAILQRLSKVPTSTVKKLELLVRGRTVDLSKLKRWMRRVQEPDYILTSTNLPSLSETNQELKEVLESSSPSFKQLLVDQSSFACPFAKKDPLKYRSCLDFTLKRIRDVKQHLNRVHPLPIYCSRCMCILGSEDQRDEHIRASHCDIQTAITYEGVTAAQKLQLTQKVSSKLTFEDQWFTIFDILFSDQIPRPKSAYKSLTVALDGFQDLTYAEGPDIILKAMISRGISFQKPSSVESDKCGLVLSAIEDGLQQIMQRWTASMQLTPPNARNPQEPAAQDKSNLPMDQKIETPDQLQSSSDKFPKKFPEATTATPDILQPAQYQDCEDAVIETNQVFSLESMQEQPAWLDNNRDTCHFGDIGQPDELNPWYADQGSIDPMLAFSMPDGNTMWQGFNQGDFFQMNEGGATEGSVPALDGSDIYHQIIDEQ